MLGVALICVAPGLTGVWLCSSCADVALLPALDWHLRCSGSGAGNRGALYSAAIVLYALTSGIAGYVATTMCVFCLCVASCTWSFIVWLGCGPPSCGPLGLRLLIFRVCCVSYIQLGGQKWATNAVLTACLFTIPFFCVFLFVNSVAWSYGTLSVPCCLSLPPCNCFCYPSVALSLGCFCSSIPALCSVILRPCLVPPLCPIASLLSGEQAQARRCPLRRSSSSSASGRWVRSLFPLLLLQAFFHSSSRSRLGRCRMWPCSCLPMLVHRALGCTFAPVLFPSDVPADGVRLPARAQQGRAV